MIQTAADFFFRTYDSILATLDTFLLPAIVFGILAIIVRQRRAISNFRRALPQMVLNIEIALFNAVITSPLLVLLGILPVIVTKDFGIALVPQDIWSAMPVWLVILISVAV